jgi:hypothetical protein
VITLEDQIVRLTSEKGKNVLFLRLFGTCKQAVHLKVLVAMIAYLLLKLVTE